jgi:putative ABC transport system permease protein
MPLISHSLRENVRIAWSAIGSQKLRAIITVSIIALGIMALVAMITATKALENKVNDEFSRLGSNTFTVKRLTPWGAQEGEVERLTEVISYQQAERFTNQFDFDALTSITAFGSYTAVVKYGSNKTNPNISVIGCDGQYLELSGYKLDQGRNFSINEIENGDNVVILGATIVSKLFPDEKDIVDRYVHIGNFRYRVIGTLASKGTTLGMNADGQCLISLGNLKKNFATRNTEYVINVRVNDVADLAQAKEHTVGLMRSLRSDMPGADNSFVIQQSDQMAKDLNNLISSVTIGGSLIGIITLLGAAIGLMNIMLVSVTERTKEIGIRKAIGASARTIRTQFLVESIVIGQLGGIVGIILGILMGNVVSYFVQTGFTIPWNWIFLGVTICFLVSVVSGFYPANRASKLDPIESLRYE